MAEILPLTASMIPLRAAKQPCMLPALPLTGAMLAYAVNRGWHTPFVEAAVPFMQASMRFMEADALFTEADRVATKVKKARKDTERQIEEDRCGGGCEMRGQVLTGVWSVNVHSDGRRWD
eukprot:963922-Rhodomonas_salina.5